MTSAGRCRRAAFTQGCSPSSEGLAAGTRGTGRIWRGFGEGDGPNGSRSAVLIAGQELQVPIVELHLASHIPRHDAAGRKEAQCYRVGELMLQMARVHPALCSTGATHGKDKNGPRGAHSAMEPAELPRLYSKRGTREVIIGPREISSLLPFLCPEAQKRRALRPIPRCSETVCSLCRQSPGGRAQLRALGRAPRIPRAAPCGQRHLLTSPAPSALSRFLPAAAPAWWPSCHAARPAAPWPAPAFSQHPTPPPSQPRCPSAPAWRRSGKQTG